MTADTRAADVKPPVPLVDFVDAQGHTVRAIPTASGLLAILSHAPGGRMCSGGHPALNRENAVELRNALDEFIARESR